MRSNIIKLQFKAKYILRLLFRPVMVGFVSIFILSAFMLSACSNLPYPLLTAQKTDADESLNREQQSELIDELTDTQQKHKDDAIKEIEKQ